MLKNCNMNKVNPVTWDINFEFRFRFHVLGFTVIFCESNEIIYWFFITGPDTENIVNKAKS